MKELTASEITADCLLILKARNVFAWRQNNLTVRHRKGIVTKGVPDILGYNKGTGVFTIVEVKKLGDSLSTDQVIFLSQAQKAGCLCMIGTQVNGSTQLISFNDYYKD